MSKRTEQIVELEAQAARLAGKAAGLHYQAAELVHLELEAGKAVSKLAEQVGRSSSWVRMMRKAWREYGHLPPIERPPWSTVYNTHPTLEDRRASQRTSVPNDPAERLAIVRKIVPTLGPGQLEQVAGEVKLTQAGHDRTPAGRKAADARGAAVAEPLERAISKGMAPLGLELAAQYLDSATEQLRQVINDDAVTAAGMRKVERAHEQLVAALTEAVLLAEAVSS